jgi:pimeloyl-ACP methyl ester carboxylesterase
VALRYAIERPERVRGLFLTSPGGAAMTGPELDGFLRAFQLGSRAEARAFLDLLYHRRPWFAPLVAGDVQRLFARDAIRSFTASVRAEHLFRAAELATLTMPVHLVWGRSERLLAFFKKSLPAHATVEEPDGFGHCPHLDAPGSLARKILDFARRAAT